MTGKKFNWRPGTPIAVMVRAMQVPLLKAFARQFNGVLSLHSLGIVS